MKNIAPDIYRKRLLLEGYFTIEIAAATLHEFFSFITSSLNLKTYGAPIVHTTSGKGKDANQGYDAFVPLIDSGIYIAVWAKQKFLSMIIYTCKDFDEDKAAMLSSEFFKITHSEQKLF